ncbi:tetratricopeptide repeat protein [Pseudonocardia kujensis]|uniref:tetratricopeptide repeat protein n=1 Tax=Pseudonocardia kujensis TaxID=1128675 RepID=UPI001E376A2F|nr:tetratricopeptide repeat protein [Pseudonocardia kujensis]MCE0764635.1 tetratricopeptide repeat protein [Pseudonocardia kujensis]
MGGPAGRAGRLTLRLDAPVGTAVQVGTVAVPLGGGAGAGPVADARPGTVPCALPPRPHGFVGRRRELAEIVRAVRGPVRTVLLTGRPGAGTTALAVEAAHRLAPLFPDGVLTEDLGDHRSGTEGPAAGLLAGLGLPVPAHAADARAELRAALAERRVLLLLDDVADAGLVAGLLPARTASFALLTSACPATMPEGTAVRVEVGDLSPDEARALLGGPGPGVDELAAVCDGLPLALRIAAARLAADPDLTPERLAAALLDRHRTLTGLRIGDRTLRASYAAAYAHLGPTERRVLRTLGALPLADITPATAAALAGVDAEYVGPALAVLAAAHLVDRRPGTPPRYALRDPARRFAEEALRDTGGERMATAGRQRVARTYLRALDRARPTPGRPADHGWFAAEWDNLVVVAEDLEQSDRAGLDQVADVLADRDLLRAPWAPWYRIQAAALRCAVAEGPPERRAELQVRIAVAQRDRGRPDLAVGALDGAEQRFLAAGDPVGAAGAVLARAEVHRELGEPGRAEQLYLRVIALLRAHRGAEAVETTAWALHGLGVVACSRGRTDRALQCGAGALERFRVLDHGPGQAAVWQGLGAARRAAGDLTGAVEAYRRSCALLADLGGPEPAAPRQGLAEALAAAGRSDAGRSDAGRSDGAAGGPGAALRAAVAASDRTGGARARRRTAAVGHQESKGSSVGSAAPSWPSSASTSSSTAKPDGAGTGPSSGSGSALTAAPSRGRSSDLDDRRDPAR